MKFSDLLNRQTCASDWLPRYRYHVSDTLLSMEDGSVLFGVELSGLPDETQSATQLEAQYDAINAVGVVLGKTVANRLAMWAYLDHSEAAIDARYAFDLDWLNALSQGYLNKFTKKPVFQNRFFVVFLLKPGMHNDLNSTIRDAEELERLVFQSFRRFSVKKLATYQLADDANAPMFSRLVDFLGYVLNGFWEPIPISTVPVAEAIASASNYFGFRLLETRFPDSGQRFCALADLKGFPEQTNRSMLSPLLSLSFPYLFTMSFALINSRDMLSEIDAQLNKLQSAGDQAVEQQKELVAAKGAIMAGIAVFGELHASIAVFGETKSAVVERSSVARSVLSSQCGVLMSPAELSAPGTFFAQMPGSFSHRPRKMKKTTRSFFGLLGLHSASLGKASGNPLGDGSALLPLVSGPDGVYHFNFHPSRAGADSRGEKKAGHTLLLGATGEGKTTTQTVLLSFLRRFNYRYFAVDKDGSMRGFIEAHGGSYFTLKNGEATGLAPLQLPDTSANREFLYNLVSACAGVSDGASAEDMADIKHGVDNVYQLPFEQRRFAVLVQNIPDRGENCIARRLGQWVHGEQSGRFAYAFDNETNAFDWASFHSIGFDVSDFLIEGHPATEPILAYLLHIKRLMLEEIAKNGCRLAVIIEEFWIAALYPTTANQIKDILKTGRRRAEDLFLVTQSPEDALSGSSNLIAAIVQQTKTKIFLPNADAEFKAEDGGGYSRVGMTETEFGVLKGLSQGSYTFLVKHGGDTAVAKLDLSGLEDYIGLLAMAADDFRLLEIAQERVGSQPNDWVPVFMQLRREQSARLKGE